MMVLVENGESTIFLYIGCWQTMWQCFFGIGLKLTEVMVSTCRVGVASAKYGEKSVYFDLGEIDNTVGNWDLYGNDDPNRYNGFQVKTHIPCQLWQYLVAIVVIQCLVGA